MAYRIAVNHLLNVRKSEMEERRMTFDDLRGSLDECEESGLPDESLLSIGHNLLVEEAKLGCITAMLMCLDRRQRLALCWEKFLGWRANKARKRWKISAENFRQLLTRARRDLYQFMQNKCGLVNTANPCRCTKKAGAFMRNGWLDPKGRQFTAERLAVAREVAPDRLSELQAVERSYAELYRDTPITDAPAIFADSGEFRVTEV